MATMSVRRILAAFVLSACCSAGGARAADPVPKATLTAAQLSAFRAGLTLFEREWPVAGRQRNENRCSTCHHRPVTGGSGFIYNATLLHTFTMERPQREAGIFRWPLQFTDARFGTGKPVRFHERQEANPPPPRTNAVSRRVAGQLHGMGSIEMIPESAIRSWQDVDDADGDGISGRFLGRFGSQGQWETIPQIVHEALVEEVGMPASDIRASDVANLVAFARGLRDPVRSSLPGLGSTVVRGQQLFAVIGCSDCHRPSFVLGDGRTRIQPYGDFLVHDMGPCLDDGVALGDASSYEWLTAPLWGLASRGIELLHDGRGGRVTQAIQFHCGEGTRARVAFNELNGDDQAAIRIFLTTMKLPD